MTQHYQSAVNNFEALVTFIETLDVCTEDEIATYKYNIFTLKLNPAYGELQKPKTTGKSA